MDNVSGSNHKSLSCKVEVIYDLFSISISFDQKRCYKCTSISTLILYKSVFRKLEIGNEEAESAEIKR